MALITNDKSDLSSTKRRRLAKAFPAMLHSEAGKIMVNYLLLVLDHKVNMLITSEGEEATALRGEIRCIKHLLSVMEQGDTPFTDSIKTLEVAIA